MTVPAWPSDRIAVRGHGLCRGAGADAAYAMAAAAGIPVPQDHTRALCAPCPVRTPCLAWALETRAAGVWGGTTAAEREHLVAAALSGLLTFDGPA